jgi:hypothetical protein
MRDYKLISTLPRMNWTSLAKAILLKKLDGACGKHNIICIQHAECLLQELRISKVIAVKLVTRQRLD